jgi:predicted Fe-Mo cluster-binding NifX family protein
VKAGVRRIAVSSEGQGGLDAPVGAHFGRCPAFTVVHVEEGRIVGHEVVVNPLAAGHEPGAVPAFLAGVGADVVLSGGMGQRAMAFFAEYGIAASPGYTGSVRRAVEAWLAGERGTGEPCTGGHDPAHHHSHGPGGCHGPADPGPGSTGSAR